MPSQASTLSGSVEQELPADVEKQEHDITEPSSDAAHKEQGGVLASRPEDEVEGVDGTEYEEPELLDPEAGGVTGALGRVLSRISTNVSTNPGPPPDGGRQAWLTAVCAHFVIMNTWGFINSFGIFQTYYVSTLNRPPSDISWIGSLQVFLTFFIGTFTGRFTDAGFFRPILLTGTALMTLGIFTTSAATEYWHLLLSQGLCMGLASGCLFCPAIATTSTYFHKKRSLAIGIAASGSVTGGLVFPSMARQLLPTIGFGWTVRAIGFVQLATLLFANTFMKSRLPPRRAGNLVEWGAFKELEYTFYTVGMFFNFWGVYFPFFYLASFSRTQLTPNLSYTDGLNLLLLLNGIGILGRLPPNAIADRVGPLNVMIPTNLIAGIAMLSWIAVKTPGQLYAWSVFYGIVAGGIQSLFPAGLSSLTTDLRKQGTRMGMVFTIVSFAVLTGPPIAGALISAMGGAYTGGQVFTGLSLLVGASFIIGARFVRQRRTKSGWAVKI